MRSRADFARFFEGLELVEPGIVPIDQWRPDSNGPAPEWTSSHYGGIGRKLAHLTARGVTRRSGSRNFSNSHHSSSS